VSIATVVRTGSGTFNVAIQRVSKW